MTDGTITFSTALDNKQLEKELQSTLKKINSLEKSISEMGSGRNALAEQAKEMGAQLDAAKQLEKPRLVFVNLWHQLQYPMA